MGITKKSIQMTITIGKYEIASDALIGQGGQGAVLKGKNIDSKEDVAIKVINVANANTRLSFEAEYRAAEKFSTRISDVCKIKDFVIEEDYAYLVMQRYDCDLFSFAFEMRETPLPEDELKKLFTKICRGVKGLHKNSVAHLDLKPENILLDLNTMEPYICDFGSAFTSSKKCTSKRKRAEIKEVPALGRRGTRKFSSPEMSSSPMLYDPFRADIYSLGVVLFMLFTGFFPTQITDADGNETTDFSFAEEKMSDSAYKLLESIVNPSPTKRFNIDDILSHEWITGRQTLKVRAKRNFRKLSF